MPGPPFLKGETVELRTVEEEDLDDLQRWVNDPRVRTTLGSTHPVNGRQEREWWESTSEDDEGVHLLACVDREGLGPSGSSAEPNDVEAVGSVGLNRVRETPGFAEIGYFFDPEAWGNGYATDAARTLCRYAFEERRLAKVSARVFEGNEASARVLEKVGFEQEGRFRDHQFVDGERIDVTWYGLLADEL